MLQRCDDAHWRDSQIIDRPSAFQLLSLAGRRCEFCCILTSKHIIVTIIAMTPITATIGIEGVVRSWGFGQYEATAHRALRHGRGGGSPGGPAGEDASAQKAPFERAVAVHAAAAEAGGFAGCIEPWEDFAGCGEDAACEVGLEAAQCLAREDIQSDRDERTGLRRRGFCAVVWSG